VRFNYPGELEGSNIVKSITFDYNESLKDFVRLYCTRTYLFHSVISHGFFIDVKVFYGIYMGTLYVKIQDPRVLYISKKNYLILRDFVRILRRNCCMEGRFTTYSKVKGILRSLDGQVTIVNFVITFCF
jgi:hypothetical protein